MRKGINPGRPRPNFPRKISEENLKNNAVSQDKWKKIEKFIEICKRKQK